jgi:hypothetical protein
MGKRQTLIYIIVILWVILGSVGVYNNISFNALAAYFSSLTAYVATYIWGETKRPASSDKKTILLGGPFSNREGLIYALVFIWLVSGCIVMYMDLNLTSLAVYFSSLTGFIGSWIAGEVYNPESNNKKQS